jgi:hypothetical protein
MRPNPQQWPFPSIGSGLWPVVIQSIRWIMDDMDYNGSVFGLLLETELVAVAALSLAAVGCLKRERRIALPADFLVAVVLLGDGGDSRVHHTAPQSQHQVQSRLLLDVVVRQTAAV